MGEEYGTIIFIAIFCLIIAYLMSLQAMFSAAKRSDQPFFEELDSPHIFLNNKPNHTRLILKALFTLKHMGSTSSQVKLWGNISLLLFVITIMSFATYFYVI